MKNIEIHAWHLLGVESFVELGIKYKYPHLLCFRNFFREIYKHWQNLAHAKI